MVARHHYRVTLMLFLILVVLGCGRKSNSEQAKPLQTVTLIQEWFPNSNYSGALFAAHEFAPKHNINLRVLPGADNIDPVAQVISGTAMFGDASADKILLANQRGADLVVVGVVSLHSPTVFVTKWEKNISKPQQFEGHRVGVLAGTNTEYVYRTLVDTLRLNQQRIREVDAPFDLASFIVADAYDVRPAFIYDEPVSLDLKGIRYHLIEPKDYGVSFIGTVYFTRRTTVNTNPEAVRNFVFSVADGWRAALNYPDDAIRFLKEYDKNIDIKRERLSLDKGKTYFEGKAGKILWSDPQDWDEMVQALKKLKKLKQDFNVAGTLDNSFLSAYYETEGKGTLGAAAK